MTRIIYRTGTQEILYVGPTILGASAFTTLGVFDNAPPTKRHLLFNLFLKINQTGAGPWVYGQPLAELFVLPSDFTVTQVATFGTAGPAAIFVPESSLRASFTAKLSGAGALQYSAEAIPLMPFSNVIVLRNISGLVGAFDFTYSDVRIDPYSYETQ